MRHRYTMAAVLAFAVALTPLTAHANARLVSVTPVDDACVYGPTGPNVEAWDVVQGGTYVIRLADVTDCANGGTDPSIRVLVMNSSVGNTPAIATKVTTGVYEFTYTMSGSACETSPIRYCTSASNSPNSGLVVGRHDTGTAQSHLRAAQFTGGCSKPTTIGCVTGTTTWTWGALKTIYR